jgi:hypothetical protein
MSNGMIAFLIIAYIIGVIGNVIARVETGGDDFQLAFGKTVIWPLLTLKWITIALRKAFVALFTT